ncbi:MAG: hypothetical protein RLZZ303_1360 [Candidatus Hydrogenedentota bacterium]|jgi:HSP20 family protein
MSALITTRNAISPFLGFRDLEERINQMMGNTAECAVGAWTPAVDLREDKEHYILEADLPGVKREDIDVSVTGNVITIKGKRDGEDWKQGDGFRSIERSYGSYQRSFRIPGGVDASKVEASYENGVLRVSLPKPENAKPRQIQVQVN